jgi:hypothetical protein
MHCGEGATDPSNDRLVKTGHQGFDLRTAIQAVDSSRTGHASERPP